MGGTNSLSARWWSVAILLSVGLARPAAAIFLDEDQTFSLRARIYSQAAVRIENSGIGTVPAAKVGQLVQHRNFFNPELEAKLAPYTAWMKGTFLDFLVPDDLRG